MRVHVQYRILAMLGTLLASAMDTLPGLTSHFRVIESSPRQLEICGALDPRGLTKEAAALRAFGVMLGTVDRGMVGCQDRCTHAQSGQSFPDQVAQAKFHCVDYNIYHSMVPARCT